MAIAVFFFIVGFILVAVHLRLKYRRVFRLADRFPGPKAYPILGTGFDIIGKTTTDLHKFTFERRAKYGRICRVWMFDYIGLMVSDPKLMEIIMGSSTKFLAKSSAYNVLRPWLGEGLLLSTGKKWHKRRKIITPAFHFSILERLPEIFDRASRILVSRLKPLCDGHAVDISTFTSQIALDIVCETSMGVQINAQTDSASAYVRAIVNITEAMIFRLKSPWQRYDIVFNLFGGKWKRTYDECLQVLHQFSNSIIVQRREELMRNFHDFEHNSPELRGVGRRKTMALLDILLQSTIDGHPLSNEDIREEVDTFMFEGHDTTSVGVAFTLYTISRHKDVQDKLFNEVREVFGDDKNAPVSHRQLHELKYLDAVIKETLRLYPPVQRIGRQTDVDIHLDDGLIIPKGVMLDIVLFVMFRDPEYFPEPAKFDPDRFINGIYSEHNATASSAFAYIPFSAGARNCIGQKFAMLEMKSIVSIILRHFELLPVGEEPVICIDMVLRTNNGVQLGLKPRIYN